MEKPYPYKKYSRIEKSFIKKIFTLVTSACQCTIAGVGYVCGGSVSAEVGWVCMCVCVRGGGGGAGRGAGFVKARGLMHCHVMIPSFSSKDLE